MGDHILITYGEDEDEKKPINAWLVIAFVCLFILGGVCLLTCGHRKSDTDKYVYLDRNDVLHFKRDCKLIAKSKGAQSVMPYVASECYNVFWYDECSKCVDEERCELLKSTIEKNKVIVKDWLVIYNALNSEYGFGDEGTFIHNMFRKEYNDSIHLMIYNDGYDIQDGVVVYDSE